MKQDHQQIAPYYESCRLPYVCWYQNDFLGGVRGMRAHEIGIYTILLNEMYARGRPLELSVERLARLCGCDKRTFTNVLEMLIEEGKILNLAHGLWNKRCEAIFQERAKFLEQKSFAGQCSAKKRKEINATLQQLLNTPARDDEQNSQAQKREEKETPNGVSQKPLFLITTEPFANASIQAPHACSTPRIPSSSNMGNQNSIPVADDQPADKASIDAQTDKASIGAQTDKASIGTQTNKASIGAQTDKASIDTQTDKASIDTQTDKASIGTQTDKASIGTQTNKASIGAQTDKASIGAQTNKASIGAQTDKASSTLHPPGPSNMGRQSQAKSRTAIAKGQRLPKDWQADIEAAILEGLSEEQARWQEKKFRDYWHAKSGREALKVDWQATWRNWFRREIERIKEHQERLAIFASQNRLPASKDENDTLYRTLINYHTN